ncbi:MAG: hypothetical protein JXA52_03875 [Planctomycetes bacterium]|nr:hypothetical protein [Planctomycetota bacterium]
MSMVVNHNISAINTLRNLNYSNRALSKSLQKLSSGYRINTGADGPADLIISEQLRAQVTGLQKAVSNTQEAMNVIGIAEGALNEMNEILRTMRQLAIHAANNGVTSPSQIAADQAEVDSSIQTIDRIANTTKYSDEFLLNGAQSLLYNSVREKGNTIIDTTYTRIDQVFKLAGVTASINFTGLADTADVSKMTTQATSGFMETGVSTGSLNEIDRDNNTLSSAQSFIITGNKGSRQFSFATGSDLSAIADSINNVSDSTGVGAQLVLAKAGFTMRNQSAAGIEYGASDPDNDSVIESNQSIVFGQTDITVQGITDITWLNEPILGKHTDGQGRMYVEVTHDTVASTYTLNLYKGPKQADGTFRDQDLVGAGTFAEAAGTVTISERNESGLAATIAIVDDTNDFTDLDVVIATHTKDFSTSDRSAELFFGGGSSTSGLIFTAQAAYVGSAGNDISVELVDPGAENQSLSVSVNGKAITVYLATDSDGNIDTAASTATLVAAAITASTAAVALVAPTVVGGGGVVEARGRTYLSGGIDADAGISINGDVDGLDTMAFSGLDLGVNTDADGKLYLVTEDNVGADGVADAISIYSSSDLSDESLVASWTGTANIASGDTMVLDEENDSGLRAAIDMVAIADVEVGTSTLTFEQAIRTYAKDYGIGGFVRLQALEGQLWDYYNPLDDDADPNTGYVNLDATEGVITGESRGTGGLIGVNGQDIFTDGLTAEASTADISAHLAFREGSIGFTTIAQVGYSSSYGSACVGQLMRESNLHLNAGINSREDLENFTGGMQFQLGEGSGDQERTVYSMQSMSVANIGKMAFTDDFDNTGVEETKTLSLASMLGGGYASLAVDAIKALKIIDQAIEDVASLRARMGAFQKNMLQTNANSLQVAIENITATESDIRDADMASETTEFTRSQILVQAGTAMLAQANVQSQNVLQLLG